MRKLTAALALLLLSLRGARERRRRGRAVPATDPISQAIVGVIIVSVFLLLAMEKVPRARRARRGGADLDDHLHHPLQAHLVRSGAASADLNVLVLLASMMAMVGVLKMTGVFEWAVAKMMNRADGDAAVVLYTMTWFTGVLSAFMTRHDGDLSWRRWRFRWRACCGSGPWPCCSRSSWPPTSAGPRR